MITRPSALALLIAAIAAGCEPVVFPATACEVACASKGGAAISYAPRVCVCGRLDRWGFDNGQRFTVAREASEK
jgi:hypothetical protein